MKPALNCAQVTLLTMSLTMKQVEWRDDWLHNSSLYMKPALICAQVTLLTISLTIKPVK